MDISTSTLQYDARQVRAQDYVAIAGFCLMLFDILTTLDVEIKLVWPAPISLIKILFMLNRYGVPGLYIWVVYVMSGRVRVLDDSYCFSYFLMSLIAQSLSIDGIGSTLMVFRVWALYGRQKRILALLLVLLFLKLAADLVIAFLSTISLRDSGVLVFLPVFDACIITSRERWISTVFVPLILFDVIIFILLFRKTWDYVVNTKIQTSLLTCMFVDGIWYFSVMLTAEVLNLIGFACFPDVLFACGFYIMWCINSTMVSRIYLNLRKTARPEDWTSLTAFKDYSVEEVSQSHTAGDRRSDDSWD